MHLWAERFDRDAGDFFALQDEITRWLARALNTNLVKAEASRSTDSPDALDYILRGRAAENGGSTRQYARAIDFFERALALDPRSVEARTLLANLLVIRVLRGQTDTAGADTARADELVEQVLAASPNDAVRSCQREYSSYSGRCPEAIPEYEKGDRLQPEFLVRVWQSGLVQILDRVDRRNDPAPRASHQPQPARPQHWLLVFPDRARGHLLQSRTDEAIICG